MESVYFLYAQEMPHNSDSCKWFPSTASLRKFSTSAWERNVIYSLTLQKINKAFQSFFFFHF